jgi:uncharacterized protein YndB with AHSA1/START domain
MEVDEMAEQAEVRRETVLPMPVEDAWSVVTEPEHLSEWLATEAEVDLRPGGDVVFRFDGGGERRGVVETVEEPERVSFRWQATDDGDDDPLRSLSTRVEITLDPVPDGTRLTIVESGFEAVPVLNAIGLQVVSQWAWESRLDACATAASMVLR